MEYFINIKKINIRNLMLNLIESELSQIINVKTFDFRRK